MMEICFVCVKRKGERGRKKKCQLKIWNFFFIQTVFLALLTLLGESLLVGHKGNTYTLFSLSVWLSVLSGSSFTAHHCCLPPPPLSLSSYYHLCYEHNCPGCLLSYPSPFHLCLKFFCFCLHFFSFFFILLLLLLLLRCFSQIFWKKKRAKCIDINNTTASFI